MKAPQEFVHNGSAFTQTGAINMGGQAITNGGDITAQHANGYMLENSASSTTNPTLIPNRANATTGIGSSTGTGMKAIIQGTSYFSVGSSDVTIENFPTSGFFYQGNNGSFFNVIDHVTTAITTPSGSTVDATNLIPAGSIVWGVIARVTTTITGATTFDVGTAADTTAWGSNVAVAGGTNTTGAHFAATWQPTNYPSATSVRLTADGSDFTGGVVRLTVFYSQFNQFTS